MIDDDRCGQHNIAKIMYEEIANMEKMPSLRIGYTRFSPKTVHCSSMILTRIIIDALASARSLRSEVPEL